MYITLGFAFCILFVQLSYQTDLLGDILPRSPFYVWPIDDSNQQANNAILSQLQSWVVNNDPISITQIGEDLSSVSFFLVNLTEPQASTMKGISTVGAVTPRCLIDCVNELEDFSTAPSTQTESRLRSTNESLPYLRKRANDPGFVTLSNVPNDMVYISQPQTQGGGVPLASLGRQYVQDSSSGDGATAYMIDTGADPANTEFDNLKSKWRWMGPDYTRTPDRRNFAVPGQPGDWPDGHGTSMLSKIVGKNLGVSKNLKTVIVRLPLVRRIEDFIEAMTWIVVDWVNIRDQDNVKVAIINISLGKKVNGPNFKAAPGDVTRYQKMLTRLNRASKEGLLVIAASGNDGGPVNSYPAMFAGLNNWDPGNMNGTDLTTPASPDLLVVGATDTSGRHWPRSQTANYVAMTGPGSRVTVARNGAQPTPRSGTSIAGYFAALPSFSSQWNSQTTWLKRVQDLRSQLIGKAYSRRKGNVNYPIGLWNGVTQVANVCGGNFKRDGSPACTNGTSIASADSTPIPSDSVVSSSSASPSASPSPTSSSAPTTTVEVGKNSVLVGNSNGPGFYTAIVNAMIPQCPTTAGMVANCASSNAVLDDVGFVEGGVADTGELVFVINDSNYTSTAQRDGMIALVASTMNNSATGSNCAPAKFEEGCAAKRAVEPGSASQECKHSSMTLCTAPNTVSVQTTDGDAGIIAFLDVAITFKIPGEAFICDDIIALVEGALALVPEANPELVTELGEIAAVCGEIESHVKKLPGANPPG